MSRCRAWCPRMLTLISYSSTDGIPLITRSSTISTLILLLRDGGISVFDDWEMPQVHHVCWFLETHKAYERITEFSRWQPLNPLLRLEPAEPPPGVRSAHIEKYKVRLFLGTFSNPNSIRISDSIVLG